MFKKNKKKRFICIQQTVYCAQAFSSGHFMHPVESLIGLLLLTIEIPKRKADVRLCKAECDALVLQLLGELLQVLCGQVLLKIKKKVLLIHP